MGNYFNHYARAAHGYFGRRDFLRCWWRVYPKDAYSPPPHHATLRRLVLRDAYLLRTSPLLLSIEALPKPAHGSPTGFEVPVATALIRADPAARCRLPESLGGHE